MGLRIVPGSAGVLLARAIAGLMGIEPAACELERFPDGELRPAVRRVRGDDVYLLQPTGPPVSDCVMELLLLLDACRRGGAGRVTAVVPYFGYARQDRRDREGEAIGVRVVAHALAGAGADRLVVVDPHTVALEAMCDVPAEMLTAVPTVAGAIGPVCGGGAVIVAPDLGAVKLARRYGALLGGPVAVVHKTRVSGTAVRAEDIAGDVAGRPAVIVDDMISTGATIEAAAQVVLARGAEPGFVVAATHGLLVADAADRLARLPIACVVVTDSLPLASPLGAGVQVVSIAPLLADAISRMHHDEPLGDLLAPA